MPTVCADFSGKFSECLGSANGDTTGAGQSRLLRLFQEFDRSGRMSVAEFRTELGRIVPVTPALERLIETEGQAGTMTYASLIRALESCNPDAGRTHQATYKLEEVRPQPALPPHRDPVSWESEVAGAITDDDIRLAVASLMSGRISTHQFVTRLAKCGIEVDEDIEMLILRHEEDPSHAKLDEFVSAVLEKRDASIGRGVEPKRKIEVPYALDTEPDPSTRIQRQQEYPKEIIANLGDKGGEFTRRLNPKRRGNYKK
ncbi:hypothetical protein FOZ61_000073 [Perkinsus olseni]|uniref:EF-hand domain-containing protein n=1 Tax=Perkinsus olseni TaxID=32597 RepID=A0A7J6MU64_PEROL|nr:hypothetical protein FOZ61_000073 [Perkinsus olseni]KAF4675129.1 hypothetical protein FOL46_002714 [Perkinsus olseni]